MSKRVRSQAVSIGPEGRRELSSIDLLDESQKNADRDGDEAGSHNDCEEHRELAENRRMPGMVNTERLKHTPDAVPQMQTQQDHAEDVPGGDIPDLKTAYSVAVNVALFESAAGMHRTDCEMQQVVNHKCEKNRAAPVHRPRRIRRDGI